MANYFDQFDSEEEKKGGNFFDQFDAKKVTKEEKPAPFSLSDTALSVAEGAVGATKGIAQAFGAENVVAEKLGEAQRGLTSMISPARLAERERRAKIEQEAAASGDTMKELGAFLGGVKEAPIQSVAQAAGSIVPAAVATVGAAVAGAPAAIATAVGVGAKFLLGALQGAGEVKGSIYENVERELIASGIPKDEARKQAIAAQDYLGKNIGNIATGTAIGTVAGGTGVESAIAKRITGKVGQEAAKGLGKRVATGAVAEAIPEGIQAGQQQYATNVALTREGVETPAFQGVLGSAARDALTSALLGGGVGALSSRQKSQIEDAKDKAEETGKPQEVQLQLPYNKDVTTGTYGTTTIIVNPDGSTQFPSEKNQFRPSATDELTQKGLKEKYTPQRIEDVLSGKREVYASEEDRANVEAARAEEARRSGKYMKQLDELIAKRKTEPKGEALKAAQSPFNTVMNNDVLASFGIGPTAKLRKEGTLEGLDIRNPEDADKIKSTLEIYKEKASQGIKTKIEDYLKRPEFTGIQPEVAPTLPETPNTIAFIPRGASEVKTYAGDVIKKGDKYFVEYDRGEGRKDRKELDPARILVNPTPDEIELMNLHKEITRLSAEPDVFKKFLMRQGIAPSAKQDLGAGDLRVSPFFRRGGQNVDQLASRAIDEGLLVSTGDDVQDTANMIDLISEALAGRYVLAGANAENYGKLDSLYGAIDRIVERGRIPNEEDIAAFIADEERQRQQDRAIEELYMADEAGVTDFELAKPTPEQLRAQEVARVEATKAEEQAVAKADKEAKEARAKKEIAQASEKASGQFELGKTAEENLSGQKDIFVEVPKVPKIPKSVDAMGKQASYVIKEKDTGKIIMETFDKKKVEALNTNKYEAVPIAKHLADFNKMVKGKQVDLVQEIKKEEDKKKSDDIKDLLAENKRDKEARRKVIDDIYDSLTKEDFADVDGPFSQEFKDAERALDEAEQAFKKDTDRYLKDLIEESDLRDSAKAYDEAIKDMIKASQDELDGRAQESISEANEQSVKKREPAIQIYSDIPNQRWLQEKKEYSSKGGKKPSGAPRRFGTQTGKFILEGNVVNRKRNVLMPVDVLARIKGENSEQQNIRQKDLEAIKKIMSETGRLPQGVDGDYVPFINVDQDGNAYVSEGNHRIMAAKALGFKYLPVEIVYFNGGELNRIGDIPPKDVIAYDLQAQDDGFSLSNYSGFANKSLSSTFENADVQRVVDKYNGFAVYNRGDLSLVRAFAVGTGQPVYIAVKGKSNALVDIDSFTGSWIPASDIAELKAIKKKLESDDAALHKTKPFVKFTNGFARSQNVPANIAGVLNGWKDMLGLGNVNVYVTTFADAKANQEKFTGPHRVIGSSALSPNDNGSMRRMADGSYYIAFKDGTSRIKMLETLAHELGHIHEREAYMNASPETRNAIRQEFNKWLESQKGKTARELVDSLRARATAKTTKVRSGMMADNLTPYWKSFSEWYADQVSRWATTSEKPMTSVEKFFDKLARSIRNFFSKIKNAGYLPNETFKQYLDDIATRNMIIDIKPTDSAITNDPEQLELFSRTKAEEMKLGDIADKTYEQMIKEQFAQKKVPFKQRFDELRPNLYDRIIKGLFDEFRFIKKYSPEAYMKARLSKAIDGALEGLLYYGQVKLTDGALDVKAGTKGLVEIYKPLGNEVDQYQIWKALNRDARMPADKRSFDEKLVAGRAKLVEGEIDGKPRIDVYREVLKEENALNKSVLDVAREQGLIDDEAYKTFSEDIYYIPFYKVMEESDNIIAISAPGKLTGQYFSKKLKGGEKQTNDLMENVLMNWSHILSAAMKNKAGVDTLKAAEAMGAAQKVKSTYDGKDLIKVVEDGKQAYYAVNDPDLVDSISLISYMGPKSAFLDVAKGFTNALRFGVTLSPAYKLRNLIRDSIQSASVSEVGLNVLDNVRKGLALSDRGNPTFMSALIGGGVFEMGVAHEGDQAKLIKRLIDKGVKPDTILDDPKKIKDFLSKAYEWYNEQGNRFENANRLALYDKLRKQGKTHLEASYAARDLMDFSLQGSFRAIKVVSQVVPFFNARLQGLYKLGRDGVTPTYRVIYNMTTGQEVEASDKQKAQRFMAVTSSVMLASMLLYMQYKDDEDFKRREDWDRDNFWWFKVNGVIFRVPKPFEIGAAGTLAERTLEQITDDKVEGKVFADRLRSMLSDTFSLNPTPQVFKPLIDLYANKDSFTGAPIESAGMERLSKQERYTDNTSALAKALGGISQVGARVMTLSSTAEGVSPVQFDYAIKAYFGWAGSTAAAISDKAVQPWSDVEKPGKPIIDTVAMGFIKTVPETQSKYVTAFYDNNIRINQAFADMKRYAENGEMEKVAKIIEEKGDLIKLQGIYDKTSKQLAEYRKYEQSIARDKSMPKEEKELEIRRIKLLISDTVKIIEEMRVGLKQ